MTGTIVIKNLPELFDMDQKARRAVVGGGVSNAFLFRSATRSSQGLVNLNIGSVEINNFNISNNIDKLIQQTNNQLQLSLINVSAGDGAAINIASNQGLEGSNSSLA